MKVKKTMTPNVEYIAPTTTLEEAAHKMWDMDCGFFQ
jgi:CBS domain-containing protein